MTCSSTPFRLVDLVLSLSKDICRVLAAYSLREAGVQAEMLWLVLMAVPAAVLHHPQNYVCPSTSWELGSKYG